MNSILLLKLVSKKHEIHVMDLLGASWWYIARPFLIEGIVYGILGSLFAWLIAFGGLMYATPALLDIFGAIPVLPYPDWFFALQAAVGAGVGLIMGIIAVLLALLRLFR
jgi:cell division transport system permease protein